MNEIRITITRFKCSYDIMEQSLNNNMAACRFIAIFCFGKYVYYLQYILKLYLPCSLNTTNLIQVDTNIFFLSY